MTEGLWVQVAALLAATSLGMVRRGRQGRFRVAAPPSPADAGPDRADGPTVLGPSDLGGAPLGKRATLVQFSSAFCRPCRATRVVLGDVAGVVPGVVHIEIDAESHLDLVRRLDIMRTPTTLVLDECGRVATRASGQPRKEQVLASLPL